MNKNIRYVGLDVHAATISVAVCEGREQPRALGEVPNTPDAVRKLVVKLGEPCTLRVCYEAGPTGYVLYWQLTAGRVKLDRKSLRSAIDRDRIGHADRTLDGPASPHRRGVEEAGGHLG